MNDTVAVPVKDYETLGIIFVKSSEVIDSTGTHTGSKITYEMLMLEAQRLGADDVVNIRIDVNEEVEVLKSTDLLFGSIYTRTTYHYTATGLAIKYTDAVLPAGSSENNLPLTGISRDGFSASISPSVAPAPASSPVSDTWKRKWVYVGGLLGGGGVTVNEERYNGSGYSPDNDEHTYGLITVGAVADVALLDFFSLGLILGVGVQPDSGVYPVLPVLAKLGYRFGQMEASLNAGYTIGLGPTLGASCGFHAGPGIIFVQGLFLPSGAEIKDVEKVFIGMLGYKIGLIDKQSKNS
jgi:hypothetical protein